MMAFIWIVITITCAASTYAAYLVVVDFWCDRSASSRDDIRQDAHEAVGRLHASYLRALQDIRRRN
ncbi:hypothetical protein DM793_12585 [Paenarthrobacter nitroguajacolicus]|nr:hypothetical protein [Paenarthrobacter nitroguajacolicus]